MTIREKIIKRNRIMKLQIKTGQKVLVKHLDPRSRNKKFTEHTVSKVGRKYFYLEESWMGKFSFETMTDCSEYVSRYKVYLSKEDVEREKLHEELLSKIKSKLGGYGALPYSVEQLKEVLNILEG